MAAILKELNPANFEEIRELFLSVFTAPPWNDDWSDARQLEEYLKDLMGARTPLALGLYEEDALIGLSLDPKIDSIMKRAEQKYLFRVPDVTGQSLLGAIDEIMENYDGTREVVKNASKNFKDLAKSDIDAVISMLHEPKNG